MDNKPPTHPPPKPADSKVSIARSADYSYGEVWARLEALQKQIKEITETQGKIINIVENLARAVEGLGRKIKPQETDPNPDHPLNQ